MKKKIYLILTVVSIFVMSAYISYSVAKLRAEAIAQSSELSISPLRGQLILFTDDRFTPYWLFRAEYKEVITGATYDVYMSIFGAEIKTGSGRKIKSGNVKLFK